MQRLVRYEAVGFLQEGRVFKTGGGTGGKEVRQLGDGFGHVIGNQSHDPPLGGNVRYGGGRDFVGRWSVELGNGGDSGQGLAGLFAGQRRAQAGNPLGAQPFGQLEVADLVSLIAIGLP